jgi:ERCC4-type nuclease
LTRYRYTDPEIKTILKSMVILCDTREQRNEHILKAFDAMPVEHKAQALTTGDYTVMLPTLPEFGIMRPTFFDRDIIIERKGSLEELSGNFTKDRERIKDEFTRAAGIKMFFIIEGASIDDILSHRYQSDLSEKSFFATLLTFQQRYDLNTSFISKPRAGALIYSILYYHVRNYLIKGEI